jgi:RNA polymerase-binding transcription factor DksA
MKSSKRIMRRHVLLKMFEYLQERYSIEYPKEVVLKGNLTLNELSALLAYKSDPQLEEYTRALNQIETGSYGVCLSCKHEIPSASLHSDPIRRACVACESRINHSIMHSHMAPLATSESSFVML